jgi:hypothetical protein
MLRRGLDLRLIGEVNDPLDVRGQDHRVFLNVPLDLIDQVEFPPQTFHLPHSQAESEERDDHDEHVQGSEQGRPA